MPVTLALCRCASHLRDSQEVSMRRKYTRSWLLMVVAAIGALSAWTIPLPPATATAITFPSTQLRTTERLAVRAASTANTARPAPLRVLTLGDSYSAGNGAGAYSAVNVSGVQHGAAGCWRSRLNYAERFAAAIRASPYNQPATVTNAACSGAVTRDYFFAKDGRPAEQAAVTSNFDVVFVTFGGNDAFFKDIVKFCLVGASDDARYCDPNLARAEGLINGGVNGGIGKRLLGVLGDIRDRSSASAKIVLVGYPFLEGNKNYTLPYARGVKRAPVAVGRRLYNINVEADALQAAVVAAVNRQPRFAGNNPVIFKSVHNMFGVPGSGKTYHGLYAARDNPPRWMVQPGDTPPPRYVDTYYHPNPDGWANEATILVADPHIPKTIPVMYVPLTTMPTGTVGTPYRSHIPSSGGRAPYSWSTTTLPTGLSLSKNGYLTGTPANAGTYRIAVEVTDRFWASATGHVTLVIVGNAPPPTVLSYSVSAGAGHSCAVTLAGGATCWGNNNSGQLGDGTTLSSSTPVMVAGLGSGVASVSAGWGHSCAVTTAGAAYCWGDNLKGQLGNGTTAASLVPVPVMEHGAGIASISAGGLHTCAVDTAGAAFCWGYNLFGELGDGTGAISTLPVPVTGLGVDVAAVSAANEYSCAITRAGAAFCWGSNGLGRLGDGTTLGRASPTPSPVAGLSAGVAFISAGDEHSCAVTTTGAAYCWGSNALGKLGDGSVVDSSTPVAVAGLQAGVATISAGGFHSCAVTVTGATYCWGGNDLGRLGDGTVVNATTPVAVAGLDTGVAAVSAGGFHSCAVRRTGTVVCWGGNSNGQLGDGTNINRTTPVSVIARR